LISFVFISIGFGTYVTDSAEWLVVISLLAAGLFTLGGWLAVASRCTKSDTPLTEDLDHRVAPDHRWMSEYIVDLIGVGTSALGTYPEHFKVQLVVRSACVLNNIYETERKRFGPR